jgi:hypothetical protein
VHPVQLGGYPQTGLVEPDHLLVGDAVPDDVEEAVQPVGGPFRHPRHGAFGYRGAEQLGQRGRSAFLRQELSHVEVDNDRGDPRPVLHRRGYTVRRPAAGRDPTGAAAGDNSTYATSKRAQIVFMRSAAAELARHNIRVNCIAPA